MFTDAHGPGYKVLVNQIPHQQSLLPPALHLFAALQFSQFHRNSALSEPPAKIPSVGVGVGERAPISACERAGVCVYMCVRACARL